jgi:hypothetical protein
MGEAKHLAPLVDALGRWHDFYALLGAASATLVGLLFVAATIGSGAFRSGRRAASRMFLTASVIHFTSLLIVCLIVLAPGQTWVSLGAMILACWIFGLGYYAVAWHDSVRDGLSAAIEWDDRIWYAGLPVVCYLFEAGSGVAFVLRSDWGCMALALSMGLLLLVGIHNAWDITLWSITRRRE